jgi:hypothetical protein
MAQAGYAGVVVSCPPCNTKMEVPAAPTDPVAAAGHPKLKSEQPLRKLQHHRQAFPLDVLPAELGQETNAQNVGKFIDQRLPPFNLLNRFMVNRIRKVLEFFEGVL